MLIFGHCLPSGIIGGNGFDSFVQGQSVLPGDAGSCISKDFFFMFDLNEFTRSI